MLAERYISTLNVRYPVPDTRKRTYRSRPQTGHLPPPQRTSAHGDSGHVQPRLSERGGLRPTMGGHLQAGLYRPLGVREPVPLSCCRGFSAGLLNPRRTKVGGDRRLSAAISRNRRCLAGRAGTRWARLLLYSPPDCPLKSVTNMMKTRRIFTFHAAIGGFSSEHIANNGIGVSSQSRPSRFVCPIPMRPGQMWKRSPRPSTGPIVEGSGIPLSRPCPLTSQPLKISAVSTRTVAGLQAELLSRIAI